MNMSEGATLETVYDPRAVEPGITQAWREAGAFRSVPDGSPPERTFCIVIPPPNVTGALHLGHALNNTLQDILVRYHRMRGYNTLWQPGTDHAGIATQAVVERVIREREGKTRHDLGRDELVRRIWGWKEEYEGRILRQLQEMGCSCDWDRVRFTLDEGLARAVRHQFFNMFKDGLIFRGKRLVNWDTELQTAVADDEIYYETVKGHFWHFRYPVIRPQSGEPEFVVIATTRPETMLGDTAVAVNPDPEAALNAREEKLRGQLATASARERAELEAGLAAIAERRATHLAGLKTLAAMARAGRKVLLPLVEREIPLIADEWADPLLGSGCVKITPAHDPNDYAVALRHDLPMINVLTPDGNVARIVEPDGTVNANGARYEGLEFSTEGRKKVLADLEALGLLHAVEDRETEIGHSDRSKTAIEPFLSDQWFVRTADVAPRAEARAADPGEPQASIGAAPPVGPEVSHCIGRPIEPRASARAAPSLPDLSRRAVLLTWSTYGSWLPGDPRGFVSRVPTAGGRHEIHNLPGEDYDSDEPELTAAAREKMQGPPVYLDRASASCVLSTIAEVCERHAVEPLAAAVMPNHVHIVCQSDRPGSELLQLFKGNASRNLGQNALPPGSPRWWTRGGSARWSRSRQDLSQVIEYVQAQSNALFIWSFDQEHGAAVELFEAARAEARGSIDAAAQTESDGTPAHTWPTATPGLASQAIAAVEDRRIRVFPERYGKTYVDWLSERRDWCISRQLWWGHRIPIWMYHPPTAVHPQLYESYDTAHARALEVHAAAIRRYFSAASLASEVYVDEAKYPDDRITYYGYICSATPQGDKAIELLIAGARCARDISTQEAVRREITDRFGSDACQAYDAAKMEVAICDQDPDVLDTWFSSALWPFSTLGWPEQTPHLKQYYPTSVLVTSRDIITNWVARMVMFGLYSLGEIPFRDVYVHPKMLDGRGETMSKSKGNGVDPVDIIHTHGADALRYSLADMCTETQDIRMPVEYLCPHCGKLTEQAAALKAEEQARKSRGMKLDRRLQPADCHRVRCAHKECGREFATQWADAATRQELAVARETSEKFEIGRNFCNKLWNAARFAFMNLQGSPCVPLRIAELPPEDRWILAQLSRTIRNYHRLLQAYQFSASVKELREFFWDSLCDWYIELTKPRLAAAADASPAPDAASAPAGTGTAQQILAFCVDQTLRLFHPTIPFITERLWRELNAVAPRRGLPGVADLAPAELLTRAAFPPAGSYAALDDEAILDTFGGLQDATRGVRDLRMRCNVPTRQKVNVTVVVPQAHLTAFGANAHIVRHMAGIDRLNVVDQATRPRNAGSIAVHELRIYVHDISDDAAERVRARKALEALEKQIAARQGKLNNPGFVAKADPELVAGERQKLDEMLRQQTALQEHLAELG